jgi:ribosomal-protein-alanine N-acetyltransferase
LTAAVNILLASTEDLGLLVDIENSAFSRPWSQQAIAAELACPEAAQYIAKICAGESQESAIGYLFVRYLTDEMHIMKIAVAAQWRHRGCATAMLRTAHADAACRETNTVVLEVRRSNHGAIAFYAKNGFETIGIRPNYYPPTGESALIMAKRLKEEP